MFDPIIRFVAMIHLRLQETDTRSRNEEGATAVEYGLLVALIAGAIVFAVTALGGRLTTLFNGVLP